MIFLKMRIKGTRNAHTRSALLHGKVGMEELLAMGPTDFTESFFTERLGDLLP